MRTRRLWLSLLIFGLGFGASSARATLELFSQFCPSSSPFDLTVSWYCTEATGTTTLSFSRNENDFGIPPQVFLGSASATATPTEWKLALNLALANYPRSKYVWTTGPAGVFTAVPGDVLVQMTDQVTVSGGTGVYSLEYFLGVDGTWSHDGSNLVSMGFCAQLAIPQGTGTFTVSCKEVGDVLPSTIFLSYADLPFEGPVNPTLYISLYALVEPLFEADIPSLGNDLITGGVVGNFSSTVTLEELRATDANGNPIPGLTLYSSSGYKYPTDPLNLNQEPATPTPTPAPAPEPGSLALVGLGLGLAGLLRRRRG